MTRALRMIPTLLTAFGASLPGATKDHRGQFVWKRAASTEDEIHAGVVDSSNVAQFRKVLLDNNPSISGTLTVIGSFRDQSGDGWTATAGTGMGSSPGSITQFGNEYCGRIQQNTGTLTTTNGILWTVAFEHNRANGSYVVLVSPHNAATATLLPHVTVMANTGFTIDCVGDPPDSTQMDVSFWVVDRA